MPQVKIRIEKGQETAGAGQELQEQNRQEARKEQIAAVSIFANQMINIAKQSINYAMTNVGVRTGNYVLQDRINDAVKRIGQAATIGMGFYTGGVAGGFIAIAGLTTQTIFEEISRNEQIRQDNIKSEYLVERSGNATKNGSRGTEN